MQSKDEQLESVREELRSRSLWNKGDLHVSKVIYFLSITIAIVWLIKKDIFGSTGLLEYTHPYNCTVAHPICTTTTKCW